MPSPLNTPTTENVAKQQFLGKARESGSTSNQSGQLSTSWSLTSSATTPNLSSLSASQSSSTINESELKPQVVVLTKRKNRPAYLDLAPTIEWTRQERSKYAEDFSNLSIRNQNKQNSLSHYMIQHQLSLKPIKINSKIALEEQEWYHGMINRVEAEKLLDEAAMGSYLVRRFESERLYYSLVLKGVHGFMHVRIFFNCKTNKFTLGTKCEQGFDTIPEMIDYFGTNPLPFADAQQMFLLFPVAARTL